MFRYKIDVLKALKEKGYNATVIRKGNTGAGEKILSESALTKIRSGKMIGIKSLNQICSFLELQPGDVIEWVKE